MWTENSHVTEFLLPVVSVKTILHQTFCFRQSSELLDLPGILCTLDCQPVAFPAVHKEFFDLFVCRRREMIKLCLSGFFSGSLATDSVGGRRWLLLAATMRPPGKESDPLRWVSLCTKNYSVMTKQLVGWVPDDDESHLFFFFLLVSHREKSRRREGKRT